MFKVLETSAEEKDRNKNAENRSIKARSCRLGDYQLLEEVARGGMGIVYKARHEKVQRIVALKMVLAGRFASDAELKRFRVESESVAQLDHPNIVPIFEVGEMDGQPYFTMKFIEGGSLAAFLGEFHAAPRKGAELIATVARAVHHAHQRGVLHRDLKPGNILLDHERRPFVTDFGLARRIDDGSDLTVSGTVLGTPNFMAPELAAGHTQMVSTATDVYSLGAVLYQIITNEPPFLAATQVETLRLLQETEVKRPGTIARNADRELETISLKCLEKEPAKRYPSALALAEDLERWLRGESILARPSTSIERIFKWVKRKPVIAALAGAVILSVLAGLMGTLWQLHETESARSEAVKRAIAENKAKREAEAAYHLTAALLTKSEIEKGNALMFRGDYSGGLAYLARALRRDPANLVAASRIASSFQTHGFGVATVRHLPIEGRLTQAALSPAGSRLITSLNQSSARVWDTRSGTPISAIMRHQRAILFMGFSPDGSKVVTASEDQTARIWDGFSGQALTPSLHHAAPVIDAQFSPDGLTLATLSAGRVQLWDIGSGKPGFALLSAKPSAAVRFSPDGIRILILSEDHTSQLWDASTGQPLSEPRSTGGIDVVNFAPRGNLIAIASEHKVGLWNLESLSTAQSILDHLGEVTKVQFSGDGQFLISTSAEGNASLWDSLGGRLIATLPHVTLQWPAGFSSDNSRVLTVSFDNSLRVWKTRDGQPASEWLKHEDRIIAASLSSDGQSVVSICSDGSLYHWQVLNPMSPHRTLLSEGGVSGVQFSPDGKRIVTASPNGIAQVWSVDTCEVVLPPLVHGTSVRSVQFSPDGQRIATSGNDLEVRIWNAESGALLASGLHHRPLADSLRFSLDGERLFAPSWSGLRSIWDGRTGLPIGPDAIGENGLLIRSCRVSPDGKVILAATGSDDARFYNAENGERIGNRMEHSDRMSGCEFSKDGRKAITSSYDNTARIWEVPSGKSLTPPLRHGRQLISANLSPDGRLAVTCGVDNIARIWDAGTGVSISDPLEHSAAVHYAEFSPDGSFLLTASGDHSVTLWDVKTGQRVAEPIHHSNRLVAANFSPDGKTMLTASAADEIWLTPLPSSLSPTPGWLPDLAEALGGERIDASGQVQPMDPLEIDRILNTVKSAAPSDSFSIFVLKLLASINR